MQHWRRTLDTAPVYQGCTKSGLRYSLRNAIGKSPLQLLTDSFQRDTKHARSACL